ncbi:hypothetical protein LLG96_04140 [bacterium]|nr:hypothetical protein [bacterium]
MSGSEFIKIGKNMCRVTIRSKSKRERLARIPGVQVSGTRVIFPEWISGSIRNILHPSAKNTGLLPEQTDLFRK